MESKMRNEGNRRRVRGVQVTCAGVAVGQSCEGRRSGLGSTSERSLSGVAPQQAQSLGLTSPPARALNLDPSTTQFLLDCSSRDGKRHLLYRF
jgi:hypothetical protein